MTCAECHSTGDKLVTCTTCTRKICFACRVPNERRCRFCDRQGKAELQKKVVEAQKDFDDQTYKRAYLARQASIQAQEDHNRKKLEGNLDVLSVDQILGEPPPIPVVEGFIDEGQVGILSGESGEGKTFVGLSIAQAVASGARWGQCATRRGAVIYCSWEGDSFNLRLKALEVNKTPMRADFFHLVRGDASLNAMELRFTKLFGDFQSACELAGTRVSLVVLDTLRMALGGSEDSSADVSEFLSCARRMSKTVAPAAVLILHHLGWQDSDAPKKRERGSSALRGNVDRTWLLAGGVLRELKARDGQKGRFRVRLKTVSWDVEGTDPLGSYRTSCVIEHDDRDAEIVALDDRAAAAVLEAEEDLRLLKLIHEHRITNVHVLRELAGKRQTLVTLGLSRLLQQGLIERFKKTEPYVLTPAGLKVMAS